MSLLGKLYRKIISLFRPSRYEFLKNTALRKRADSAFTKRLSKFKKKYKRNPNKKEVFLLVVNASHDAVKQRGGKGHWTRQRVRKYLLEKNNIAKNYKMKPSKNKYHFL